MNNVIDGIISNVKMSYEKEPSVYFVLPIEDICFLCVLAIEVFKNQRMCLRLKTPIKLCGDIHGHFDDLMKMLVIDGAPPLANYLFLGDYVDRGRKSLETICLLLAYAVKYPNKFWLLRGNHEDTSMNMHGFKEECITRSEEYAWHLFQKVFSYMPVAAIIDDTVFCCHGGASQSITSVDDIDNLPRPNCVPCEGLMCDLLWADPNPSISGYQPSPRKISYQFGDDALNEFLTKVNCSWMVRAHQVIPEGFMYYTTNEKKMMRLLTIFSACGYCGHQEVNGAMMNLMQCKPLLKYNFVVTSQVGIEKTGFVQTNPMMVAPDASVARLRRPLQSFFSKFRIGMRFIRSSRDSQSQPTVADSIGSNNRSQVVEYQATPIFHGRKTTVPIVEDVIYEEDEEQDDEIEDQVDKNDGEDKKVVVEDNESVEESASDSVEEEEEEEEDESSSKTLVEVSDEGNEDLATESDDNEEPMDKAEGDDKNSTN